MKSALLYSVCAILLTLHISESALCVEAGDVGSPEPNRSTHNARVDLASRQESSVMSGQDLRFAVASSDLNIALRWVGTSPANCS